MLVRPIIYLVLIYLLYRLFKNFGKSQLRQSRWSTKNVPKNNPSPPFNLDDVEEIEFEEVKKKKD